MTERLLIVDDDERLAAMLQKYLEGRGFAVDHRGDIATGLLAARTGLYAALVLDVMLPDGDGFDALRTLRAESQLPVIMLTARGDPMDRVVGLELGADDYLPKPFDPRELLARIRAVLRRSNSPRDSAAPQVLSFGNLTIDKGAREVRLNGQARPLTSHQFALLLVLAERAGRVQSRAQLMEAVRGEELEAFDRSIDVHISRIRTAVEDDPKKPRRILTVRGAGYVFTKHDNQ